MRFDRRTFLQAGVAVSLSGGLPRLASASGAFDPQPGRWRSFEIITKLEIVKPSGGMQAWVPLPSVNEADWFKSLGSSWTGNGKTALMRDPKYGAAFLHVEWKEKETAPVIKVTSRISTRDRVVDLSKPRHVKPLSPDKYRFYTEGTELIPVDGIVKQTSDKIVAGAETDVEKAQAIYQWIVVNCFRDAKVRGCGIGDIASMLKTGDFGGKCADLNALFVGLTRAAGVPARDIYGIRVAPSRFGYNSLGATSAAITKAQHCRAEVYLSSFGWVAADPADVRKVMLEEPPGDLTINDPKVVAARKILFGAWEGNWLAYNFAHDVRLPGSRGPELGYLMYPQAECGDARLDCLDPEAFCYTITASEITA